MRYLILLIIAMFCFNSCLSFKGNYRDDKLTMIESKEKHFVLDMQWPGDMQVHRVVCGVFKYGWESECRLTNIDDPLTDVEVELELRALDLLNFLRLITLMEQRNVSIENSKNLMVEYKLSVERFNALVSSRNTIVEESNKKEFDKVVLSWATTGSVFLNVLLILLIAL